jgi:uncharacterized membrane protein
MTEQLTNVLKVLAASMLPYLELRGAIPLAWQLGFGPLEAYTVAVIGNMIPVIPIIVLIEPVLKSLSKVPIFKNFCEWVLVRSRKQVPYVQKYGFLGLTIFVAIPLPMTGAWSGATIAFVLGMRKRLAFLSVLFGVLSAGLIVTGLTYGLAYLFGR